VLVNVRIVSPSRLKVTLRSDDSGARICAPRELDIPENRSRSRQRWSKRRRESAIAAMPRTRSSAGSAARCRLARFPMSPNRSPLDLETPLAKQDKRLRLRGLLAKGDIDLEWDVLAAERDWREVETLERDLHDAG
jgi:hypothetical protein